MKIVIVEDNREWLVAMCKLLSGAGYETEGVLVLPGDTCEMIRDGILHESPDMILMDEVLTHTLRGHQVLEALGGEFFKPGISGGNPRVISISGDPSLKMAELVGGEFFKKRYLQYFGDELVAEVARCAALIS